MDLLWDSLYTDKSDLPRVLFFEELSGGYFRYGLDKDLNRSLFFQIPDNSNICFVAPVLLANIKLEEVQIEGNEHLALILLNGDFNALFDDLIKDMVEQTKEVPIPDLKSSFVSLCSKWFEFLQPGLNALSDQQLKGLFAELSFLNYLIDNSVYSYNDILESWKGPYGKGHDFELGINHFEIKGIDEFKNVVRISSEYQLDYLSGQTLTLVVSRFTNSSIEQFTIHDIINEIFELLRSRPGTNIKLFWNALNKAGLNILKLHEFDSSKFFINSIEYYCVSTSEFPGITRNSLSDNIMSVSYELSLINLEAFKLTSFNTLI